MHDTITPYVLQYQLKRNLRPFTREEILKLPTEQTCVYVLWRKTRTEGRNECVYVGESQQHVCGGGCYSIMIGQLIQICTRS